MTLLPESLRPYLPMIIAVQVVLFASAILVGGFLIIRRLSRKPPLEGQILEEKEKLAAEIHTEINRLRELRDRLFDGYAEKDEPTFNSKPQQSTSAQALTAVANAALGPTAKEIELQKANDELKALVDALRNEISALKAAGNAAAGALSPEKIEEMKKSIEAEVGEKFKKEAGEKLIQHETTIKDLSNRLEEYEIFEEELAQIKKYKQENDQLKQQVTSAGGSPTTAFSEDDIAQLFNEMTSGGAEFAAAPAAAPAPAAPESVTIVPQPAAVTLEPLTETIPASATATGSEAPEKTVFKESAKVPEPVVVIPGTEVKSGPSLDDELEKFLSAAEPEAPAVTLTSKAEAPSKDFEKEAVAAEPDVLGVNTENAEAMAMLGGDADELMKEFEKVLAPTEKDK